MSDPMQVDPPTPDQLGPITRADLFQLSHKETELFRVLMGVVNEFQLNVVLRVAGGWVRDKVREPQSLFVASEQFP